MMWRVVSSVALVLLIAIVALWLVDGMQVYTKTARQNTVRDELFGTDSVRWEEGLWIGLDVVGPGGAVLVAIALFGLVRSRRNKGSS